MKLKIIVFVAVAFAGVLQADTFSYSYNFNTLEEPQIVSGTFCGTLDGLVVKDVSGITCFIEGFKMPGQTQAVHWAPELGYGSNYVISFDETLNHFNFSSGINFVTGDFSSDWWYFSMGEGNAEAWAAMDLGLRDYLGIDSVGYYPGYHVTQSWKLTHLGPEAVPENGATLLMLISGLGFILLLVRHRDSIFSGKFCK